MFSRQPVAVIDLGTNTFHLLIVAPREEGGFDVLYREKIPVKIGQMGISEGRISHQALARALRTLHHFRQRLMDHKVGRVVATATSAIRSASNRDELLEAIRTQMGIRVQVISGELEARLIHEGVAQALSLTAEEPSLIMDIGGGSVEFIISEGDEVLWLESFEVGGQRLMDRFHTVDPMSAENLMLLSGFLEEQLANLKAAIEKFQPTQFIGASGTFETLFAMMFARDANEATEISESEMRISRSGFDAIYERLRVMSKSQRLREPGMIEMRADMIVVASALVDKTLTWLPELRQIRISSYALKEGLLGRVLTGRSLQEV